MDPGNVYTLIWKYTLGIFFGRRFGFFAVKPGILNAVDKQLFKVHLLVCSKIGSDCFPLLSVNLL